MRDYPKEIIPGREKVAQMFEGILKILTADELIMVRAEKALNRLLDYDFNGDPGGEAQRLWNSLLSDVNQTICGGEELDEKWAEAVIQKILKLLFLTHEITSRRQWIEITNTKISKEPVHPPLKFSKSLQTLGPPFLCRGWFPLDNPSFFLSS